jgi:hypothetical protein
MNKSLLTGIILTVVGVCMLIYQGFRFTTQEKVVDLGPLEVNAQKTRELPIPPIVGWIVTVAGVAVFVNGMRSSKA